MAERMDSLKHLFIVIMMVALLPFMAMADDDDEFESDDYLSFSQEARPVNNDPLEGINRAVHEFNDVLDLLILEPVSEVYSFVLPKVAQNTVFNFLENIEAPVVFANSILQGDPQNVFVTFWRFVFNTTLGVGGLFDVATELGIPERNHEDFGQTLGVWGVGQGPYLVIPFLGPSTLRDFPGRIIDIIINPFTYALKPGESTALTITNIIDTRARLDRFIDQVNESSLDPYATFRSLYLQRRQALVNNFADAEEIR